MTNLLILRIMKYAFKSYDEALEIVIKEINLKLKVAEVLKSKTCSSFCSVSKYFVSFFYTHTERNGGIKSNETHFISVKNKKWLQKRLKSIEILNIRNIINYISLFV